MSLINASRSETTKQFTTSLWWILAIVLLLYVAMTSGGLGWALAAAATGTTVPGGGPALPGDELTGILYSTATAIAYVFPLLIGTLMVTTEFRHKTLTPTFLATPRRATALAAKVVVGVILGVLYGVVGIVASAAPGAAVLALFDLPTELAEPATWALLARMILAFVLWVLIGIGVGTLVRNQVGAIVGVLVFTQFLEPVIRFAAAFVDGLDEIAQFLPGASSDALVGASLYTAAMTGGADTAGPQWWVGGLWLLGYALVLLVLGYLTSWRRDVA